MKDIIVHSILYSSIKEGEKVYCLLRDNDLLTIKLDEDKCWHHKVFKGTVIDSSDFEEVGKSNKDWCADMFFTFKEYPCDDDSLRNDETS